MNRLLIVAVAALSLSAAAFAQGKQAKCPVMNSALSADAKSVAYTGKNAAYKGKSVKICCGGCEGQIKANPDKFFKVVYGASKPAAKKSGKKG